MKDVNDSSRYVVICGAQMHFDTWGNHDGTTSCEPNPSGTDLIFYEPYDDNFTTTSACVDKNFKLILGNALLDEEIMLTKDQLNELYSWLRSKPYGKLLVKSAKDNTIKLSKTQIHNIQVG